MGFEIGSIIYAVGNLVYENGRYKIASSQGEYGDYWYKNPLRKYYLLPLKDQAVLNNPSKLTGGVVDDVCKQLGAGWRIPTPAEMQALKDFSRFDFLWNQTHNYKHGTYTKPNHEVVSGMYFGTQIIWVTKLLNEE